MASIATVEKNLDKLTHEHARHTGLLQGITEALEQSESKLFEVSARVARTPSAEVQAEYDALKAEIAETRATLSSHRAALDVIAEEIATKKTELAAMLEVEREKYMTNARQEAGALADEIDQHLAAVWEKAAQIDQLNQTPDSKHQIWHQAARKVVYARVMAELEPWRVAGKIGLSRTRSALGIE